MITSTKQRVFGLDLMRVIAISLVVASHGAIIFYEYNNIFTDFLQIAGVVGVEVFFVLSGFLIGNILFDLLHKETFSFKSIKYFWIRRWFRTLPLYFLVLIMAIGKEFLFSGVLPTGLWKYFVFLQNFNASQSSFFSVSWSLTIEEYSYLLAPIILLLFKYLIGNKRLVFLFSSLALITLFILTKYQYYLSNLFLESSLNEWNSNLKGVMLYRLDSIFYGFLVVYLYKVFPKIFKEKRFVFLLLGIVLFVVIYGLMLLSKFKVQGFELFWNLWYLPLNSVAIAFGLPFLYYLKVSSGFLQSLIKKISLYSYAIYLLHYTLILSVMMLLLPISNFSFAQKLFILVVYLLSSYYLSSVVYRYYEKPMTNLRDNPIFKEDEIE